jgi:ABC-type branched-subunit amino acid transport system substrate-binding protein
MTLGGHRAVRPHDAPRQAEPHRGVFCFWEYMKQRLKIGLLYSTTGPYGTMGVDARDGAVLAIAELQARYDIEIETVFIDPHGDVSAYVEGARALLREHGCRHIIGTITSLARKEVLPLVEKHDALLWYLAPYEGFEANENVIYIAGCPNQHLLPLFDYLIPRYGRRPYLLGANYVWGWEMNRLARELISDVGGEILGERYLPLEETDVDWIVSDIEQRRPSFILNNLVGPASFAFLTAMKALALRDPAFSPERCPVVSCDLTECELDQFANGVATGQLSAAAYFDSVVSPENAAFKARVHQRFGNGRRVSSFFASTYTAVTLCVEAMVATRSDDPQSIRKHLAATPQMSLLGPIRVDENTHHAALPFYIGKINEQLGFDIIASKTPIVADPYLTGRVKRMPAQLRVVS